VNKDYEFAPLERAPEPEPAAPVTHVEPKKGPAYTPAHGPATTREYPTLGYE